MGLDLRDHSVLDFFTGRAGDHHDRAFEVGPASGGLLGGAVPNSPACNTVATGGRVAVFLERRGGADGGDAELNSGLPGNGRTARTISLHLEPGGVE